MFMIGFFVEIQDGSTINNSSISGAYQWSLFNWRFKITNSKIYNLTRHAFEIQDSQKLQEMKFMM